MYVLGIACHYHDASATLLKDGCIVAAALEERFTRKKHDTAFPENAIRYCLQSQGISASDLTAVAFYEKPFLKFERVLFQHMQMFPWSLKTFVSAMPAWLSEKLRLMRTIRKVLKYHGEVFFVEHHLSHAASAFLLSPFRNATIVTVDGVGEWSTTTYGIGRDAEILLLKDIRFPHSLGLLYSTMTAYLGFSVNNAEYKVMGLSAYGNQDRQRNRYCALLRKVIDSKADGSYHLDLQYFTFHFKDRMPSEKLCALLGDQPRKPNSPITQRHKDIAAALQMVLEEVLTKILHHAYAQTKCPTLVMAGGVALNSVWNGKILQKTPFKRVWIQPDAGDGGSSMGAAAYVYHTILGQKRTFPLEHAYLGPAFSTDDVRTFLDSHKIQYRELENERHLIETAAQLIAKNQIVGWFQGAMEWGPRALGARSILSNPMNPHMQHILNQKVKHRERFRPFAPSVCAEDASTYFECDKPLPLPTHFMLMVYPIKKRWRTRIPAVTHVDGSGRLQAVQKTSNPRFYALIKRYGQLTGIPMLINTSFNVRGEPIVCTPFDAYRCMMGTGIDYLLIDRFLIRRADNLRDAWNSESTAMD